METSSLSHGASRALPTPYLALKHVSGSAHPVFFSISEKKAIDAEAAAELTNNNFWATPQGWILVRDSSSATTYLLDPHSPPTGSRRIPLEIRVMGALSKKRRIPLPHLTEPEHNWSTYSTCLLSEYPAGQGQQTNSSCIVLLVETDDPVIWYCRIGGKEWARHEYDIGTQGLDGHEVKEVVCQIASCKGRFYFEGCTPKGLLGVLEFCPAPSFRTFAVPDALSGTKGFQKTFMVESKQELYMVSLKCGLDLDAVHGFSVHKMDFVRDEWHRVDNIGDQVFLLSWWYFGASRSAAECGLQRNCIYMLYPGNKRLVMLNLEEPTFTMVHDFDEAPAYKQALWMLPTHP